MRKSTKQLQIKLIILHNLNSIKIKHKKLCINLYKKASRKCILLMERVGKIEKSVRLWR